MKSRKRFSWVASASSALVMTLYSSDAFAQSGSPLDDWTWRLPKPQGNNLVAIAYGNGVYLAVGESDQAVVSTNGQDWASHEITPSRSEGLLPPMSPVRYFRVTFGRGRFLAERYYAPLGTVATTSVDGLTWEESDWLGRIFSVAGGPQGFVASTDFGVRDSDDGLNWRRTTFVPPAAPTFGTVTAANGRFFFANATNLWLSDDGHVFTLSSRHDTGTPGIPLVPAAWGAGHYVGVNSDGFLHSSTDGVNWIPCLGPTQGVGRVCFAQDRFAAAAASNASWTSTNGVDWEYHTNVIDHMASPIDFGPARIGGHAGFVTVGRSGNIFSSTNGHDWHNRVYASRNNFRAVMHQGGLYVTVGNQGTIRTSPDGVNWTVRLTGIVSDLRAVAASPQRFVAVGDAGAIVTSTNGVDWDAGPGTLANLFGLTWASNQFLGVGDGGVIVRSTNGLDWQVARSGTAGERLHGITRGPDLFVATGQQDRESNPNPLILTSPDAITWMERRPENAPLAYLKHVTYGQGMYMAVGTPPSILVSSDGLNWTNTTPSDPMPQGSLELNGAVVGAGTLLVVGDDGFAVSSLDGFHWVRRYTGTAARNIRSVVYADGVFTAVGNNDSIWQSGVVLPRLTERPRADGFDVTLTGETNRLYGIETSADLIAWNRLTVITNTAFRTTVHDTDATNSSRRFYRAVAP